ncbi:hypothetical protein IJL65_05755 [bacterium]|nr:hypothetical protein [bacterium]
MKKSLIILSLSVLLILSGCGKSSNVVEYNDSFVALVKECTDSTQDLFKVYQAEDSTIESISDSLDNCIKICENSKDRSSKMGDFDKDSSLKDAVVDLLSTEVDYLKKFSSTSRYWNIDNITEEDKVAYDSIVNDLYQSEEILNSKFTSLQTTQEAFAAKHGLKLE